MARKRKDILYAQSVPIIGSNNWADVSAPVGWSWSLPFTIQQSGNQFRIKPSFTLQGRANITVSKTYYVDSVNGNDSNTGLSWAQAFKTLNQVQTAGDADRVYIASGSYFTKAQQPSTGFTRDIEVIALGDGATITADQVAAVGSFSKTGTYYYEATITDYVAAIFDDTNLDSYGLPTRMALVADAATVDTTPNSWFREWNGTKKIYVRTHDDRAPDSDLKYMDTRAYAPTADNRVQYFKNITFKTGVRTQNSSATGGMKMYFDDCTFFGLSILGVNEFMMHGCTVHGTTGDGVNIDARNSIESQVVESKCTMYYCGSGGSDQASTTHNGCDMVRIMGKYYDIAGQCIADTGGGETWMLGTEVYNSTVAGIGIYSTVTMWLDSVYVHDQSNYDLQNTAGNTIYHHNCTLTGSNDIGGTYTAY